MRVSESLDETVRQLDEINRGRREQIARDREALSAIVANLGVPWADEEDTAPGPSRRRPDESRPARPRPGAFDEPDLPHPRENHPFGPEVRRRLTEAALEKGGW